MKQSFCTREVARQPCGDSDYLRPGIRPCPSRVGQSPEISELWEISVGSMLTRISSGLQKTLVDNHLAGKKVRLAMIKDISLSQVEELSSRVSHEPILWEQSDLYETKVAVRGDKRKKPKDKPMLRYLYCLFMCSTFIRIRKHCQICLTKRKKEVKTQCCCAQCGDVAQCMQQGIKNSCWTLW